MNLVLGANYCKVTSDKDCWICLEPMKGKKDVFAHTGGGEYHPVDKDCIQKWLFIHDNCPFCRELVNKNSILTEKDITDYENEKNWKRIKKDMKILAKDTLSGAIAGIAAACLGIGLDSQYLQIASVIAGGFAGAGWRLSTLFTFAGLWYPLPSTREGILKSGVNLEKIEQVFQMRQADLTFGRWACGIGLLTGLATKKVVRMFGEKKVGIAALALAVIAASFGIRVEIGAGVGALTAFTTRLIC